LNVTRQPGVPSAVLSASSIQHPLRVQALRTCAVTVTVWLAKLSGFASTSASGFTSAGCSGWPYSLPPDGIACGAGCFLAALQPAASDRNPRASRVRRNIGRSIAPSPKCKRRGRLRIPGGLLSAGP
jgi:hypothetical protein